MSLEELVIQALKELPIKKKRDVLVFIETLKDQSIAKKARTSPVGLWSDLNTNLNGSDISEAREHLWGDFPREIEK